MANNRLLLVHKSTNKYLIIGKHMGGAMYPPNYLTLEKGLNNFFDDTYCESGDNEGFYCVTENDAPDNLIMYE